MSGISRNSLWLAAVMMLSAGCGSTVVYDGPRLPKAEVARIEGDQTIIHIVDDDRIEDNSAEILPGEHTLAVSLQAYMPFGVRVYSDGDQRVCFTAFAGRRYETKPAPTESFGTGRWRAAVFDKTAQVFVDHPCPVARHHPVVSRSPTQSAPNSDPANALDSAAEEKPALAPTHQEADSE